MGNEAERAGLRNTVIINSCAVTGEAVRQTRQAIRRARRGNAGARIVVTGCAAQIDPGRFAAMEETDLVLGNREKMNPASYRDMATRWATRRAEGGAAHRTEYGDTGSKCIERPTGKMHVGDIFTAPPHDRQGRAGHDMPGDGRSDMAGTAQGDMAGADAHTITPRMATPRPGRMRANVRIQTGCDHRCTFCIIPYGRGPSRSRPAASVIAEIRELLMRGCLEIVLTGVDLTAWGRDLGPQLRLGTLVRAILDEIGEDFRLRLSSIDSVEADDALLDVIAGDARLMPHLHLSLQAGNDLILKRMKRRHLRADAIGFCRKIRELRPDIVFGADFIAGFPTESEDMFADTLRLVDECALSYLHVFPFSARPPAPAARMPQLARDVITRRARALREKGAGRLSDTLRHEVGLQRKVLIEKHGIGRSAHYHICEIAGQTGSTHAYAPGTLVDVDIIASSQHRLIARPCGISGKVARNGGGQEAMRVQAATCR